MAIAQPPKIFTPGIAVLDPDAMMARKHQRSYWRLRYTDGRILSEWQHDWSLVPFNGRQSLRLYCPDGQVAELGNTKDATGRLFQLHGAVLSIGMGGGGAEQQTRYQLIGIIDGLNGECQCAVFEYASGCLMTFRDNVHAMEYEQIGALNQDALGIRPD